MIMQIAEEELETIETTYVEYYKDCRPIGVLIMTVALSVSGYRTKM